VTYLGNNTFELGSTGVHAALQGGKWVYTNGSKAGQQVGSDLANQLNKIAKG